MDYSNKLQEIFNDDPLGLLKIDPSPSPARNEGERLVASFEEINNFYEQNNREPIQGNSIQEYQLYSRLRSIREDPTKMDMLKSQDRFGLLNYEQKQINSLEDILNDDTSGILKDDSEGLYDLKHVSPSGMSRAETVFVAKRKVCKNFSKYEQKFKDCQSDLKLRKRKLLKFHEDQIQEGAFFVANGLLVYVDKLMNIKMGKFGKRDGRTHLIFENGTESNMLFRSLGKALFQNGQGVSDNTDKLNESFIEKFSNITDEDEHAGFIYILKSKSENQKIKEIQHLYKIGFSKIAVEERIKNASQEPTYLMAEVRIIMTYKCFNMNPQKLEQLLHNFFGNSCLNVDVFDNDGNRHTPREWFIAPLDIIEQAVHLIISGDIIKYRYDSMSEEIVNR